MDTSDDTRDFTIRLASVDDIDVLVRHRCEMFRDMGQLREDAYQALARASARYFAEAIPAGEYVAWLVAPADEPGNLVAGGGVQLRKILPRPDRDGHLQKPGPQALVVNVFTEADWRLMGLAELVMLEILGWCREHGVASIVLHASTMGHELYERLGFAGTNEMSYPL